MRLYRLRAVLKEDHGDKNMLTVWVGTLAEAAAQRAEWQRKHGVSRNAMDTAEVEVPTTKKELLEWLNANASN